MKKLTTYFVTILILILGSTSAQSIQALNFNDTQYKRAETNLLVGLKSDNTGLQASCAYFLGEMLSKTAVIPLMEMMRKSSDERLQIIAALSLAKIGDNRGIFLIKRNLLFSDNERLKRVFEQFLVGHKLRQPDNITRVEYRHIALSDSPF